MLAIYSIPIGQTCILNQNESYTLPVKVVYITSTVALESSIDEVAWTIIAQSTTGVLTAAKFVRCPTASAIVMCKAH